MTEQTNDIDELNLQIRNKYNKNIEIWKSLDDKTLYDNYWFHKIILYL